MDLNAAPPPSSASASAPPSSSAGQPMIDLEIKEDLYSMELARRAVARAAFHLGVESMTERTLDVLADVLLSYLSRMGSTISHLVESSGRTSAHANVLDALQACEIVSAPAVQRVYVAGGTSTSSEAETKEKENSAVEASTTDGNASGGGGTDGTSDSKVVDIPEESMNPIDRARAIGKGVGGGSGAGKHNDKDAESSTDNKNRLDAASAITGSTSSTSTTIQSSNVASADWKGLASFLFGPDWYEESQKKQTSDKKSSQSDTGQGDDSQQKDGPTSSSKVDDPMDVDGEDNNEKGTKAGNNNKEENDTAGGAESGDDPAGRGVGGKFLARDSSETEETTSTPSLGWNAPFYEEVLDFPNASETCANPHALPLKIGSAVQRKVDISEDEVEQEIEYTKSSLELIPDAAFGTAKGIRASNDVDGPSAWGSLKRKKDEATSDDMDIELTSGESTSRPAKRVKISVPKGDKTKKSPDKQHATDSAGGKPVDDEEAKPFKYAYVPSFYPLPPTIGQKVERGRTIVDLSDAERHQRQKMLLKSASAAAMKSSTKVDRTEEEALDVRSSLVQLDQHSYWGSGWENASNSGPASLAVPMGRPESVTRSTTNGSASIAGANAPGQGRAAEVPINPVNRPSMSTVSRILEGSVDAAAM